MELKLIISYIIIDISLLILNLPGSFISVDKIEDLVGSLIMFLFFAFIFVLVAYLIFGLVIAIIKVILSIVDLLFIEPIIAIFNFITNTSRGAGKTKRVNMTNNENIRYRQQKDQLSQVAHIRHVFGSDSPKG
jgi:hypothetical protein